MKHKRLPQFYFDNSIESKTAQALLDEFEVKYALRDVRLEESMKPPIIQSGHGDFRELDGIKSYIELVCDLDEAIQ